MTALKLIIIEALKAHWKYIVVFVLGVAIGCYVTYACFPRTVTVATEVTKVETQVMYKDHTEVGYVPKVDNESTDVEVNKAATQVTVKVNGVTTALPLIQGETQKFEQGKVVVDQSTALNVDVTAQVESQVEQGINNAFKAQAKKAKIKLGVEGSLDESLKPDAALRLSRQSERFDIDIRANLKKQSIGVTMWL